MTRRWGRYRGGLVLLCLIMLFGRGAQALAAPAAVSSGSYEFADVVCPVILPGPALIGNAFGSVPSPAAARIDIPALSAGDDNALPASPVLSVDRLCGDCSPAEKKTLLELLATRGRIVQENEEYAALDCGVSVHKKCLDVFGGRLPGLVQQALVRGVQCLGATQTHTTAAVIREMLQVLGRVRAPKPAILCRALTSDNMKAVGVRSDDRKQSPVIVLNPVLAKENSEYIQSVIFHEFLHLGGDGHPHGAQRELATPCQSCCFGGRPFGDIAKPYACTVCTSDYADKYDAAYLHDLGEWAKRTPGSEFIYRINMMDGVKRAGGDVGFLAELVETFKDHPFGFELARLVTERYALKEDAAARVAAVARKRHGHVTKRFVSFARAVSEAMLLRFDGARDGGDAEHVLEGISGGLLASQLPGKGDVPRLDLPIFYKYYYEFALLRGVLADEVYSMWNARWKESCQQFVGIQDVLTRETPTLCEDIARNRDVFACQKMGLDYNPETRTCRK